MSEPGDHNGICSDYFVQGWHGEDRSDDNYGPALIQYKVTKFKVKEDKKTIIS